VLLSDLKECDINANHQWSAHAPWHYAIILWFIYKLFIYLFIYLLIMYRPHGANMMYMYLLFVTFKCFSKFEIIQACWVDNKML